MYLVSRGGGSAESLRQLIAGGRARRDPAPDRDRGMEANGPPARSSTVRRYTPANTDTGEALTTRIGAVHTRSTPMRLSQNVHVKEPWRRVFSRRWPTKV